MRVALIVATLTLTGCATDAAYAPPPVTDPTKLFWSLALNHRAVTLSTVSPYDTIQLVATPRTVKGAPVRGLPAPTFTSLDLQHVQVSATGLVQATGVVMGAEVVATVATGDNMHTDTLVLNVTDTIPPPVLSVLTIRPDSGDSAKRSVDQPTTITPRAYDPSGNEIDGLAYDFATSDSTTATIDRNGLLAFFRPGQVTLYATTTAYGVTKSDSLRYTIGYALFEALTIIPEEVNGKTVGGFLPSTLVLGPGAIVVFTNTSAPPTDVTFTNPANVDSSASFCSIGPSYCGSGNIPAFAFDPNDSTSNTAVRIRQFPVPGTYPYHSTISGATGSIVIMNR